MPVIGRSILGELREGREMHGRRLYYVPLRRLSHTLSEARLTFICDELEGLQSLNPVTAPQRPSQRLRGPNQQRPETLRRREVIVKHPWAEWRKLVERVFSNGYLDLSSSEDGDGPNKTSNLIRTACLNFARHRFDLIRYFSRKDIHIMVGAGCPSLDRKVINSGKRLRAYVGINEGGVCSKCSFRGSCERAYVKAREDECGRTVDIMRFLLTYGLDLTTESVERNVPISKIVEESVRKLMNEMSELSVKEINCSTSKGTSQQPLSGLDNKSTGHQMPKGQTNVLMKHGDWICPKCNFLNFAKNIKCLRCNGVIQERLNKLREEREHLPLKKGDWICEKCNFFNFAKNTRCIQCDEKPTRRQLNPGEWECTSCNYINFRKNMVCLKCDWKRPKASYIGDVPADSSRFYQKHSRISFVRNDDGDNSHRCQPKFLKEEGESLWTSDEDGTNDDDNTGDNAWNRFVDDFPIVGGKKAISRDPLLKKKWKEKMLSGRGSSLEAKENTSKSGDPIPVDACLHESNVEDEIAEWFR